MNKPLSVLLLACLAAAAAFADDAIQTNTFQFADPAKPGTVRITLLHGSVRVHGTDAADVVVRSNVKLAAEHRADGLRVIGAASGLQVHQHDNVIVLEAGMEHHGDASFDIDLPRRSSVAVTTYTGRIQMSHIGGDVDVHSMSGSINLEHMSGGASVEANNGRVHADYDALTPGHPLSLSSLNGEVVLELPADAKANLQLRTQNGTILTDYSEKQLVTTDLSASASPKDQRARADHEDSDDGDDDGRDAMRASADSIRQAVRDAAREAQAAMREATEQAREGLAESGIILPPLPPLPPMTGGKTISGVLNGGGVEVQITTLNGDVTVRKLAQGSGNQ
ncbi:MAG TPA: DUF4097 family beta strand repeat-containing protein [Opitutaceae bacterium]|jgi:hypothetical protein|nr:DUF4097 family beta strand repeat-containing protein [Opitutaceae bacterium]